MSVATHKFRNLLQSKEVRKLSRVQVILLFRSIQLEWFIILLLICRLPTHTEFCLLWILCHIFHNFPKPTHPQPQSSLLTSQHVYNKSPLHCIITTRCHWNVPALWPSGLAI